MYKRSVSFSDIILFFVFFLGGGGDRYTRDWDVSLICVVLILYGRLDYCGG